jgi:hypothetical protein
MTEQDKIQLILLQERWASCSDAVKKVFLSDQVQVEAAPELQEALVPALFIPKGFNMGQVSTDAA